MSNALAGVEKNINTVMSNIQKISGDLKYNMQLVQGL
jgi:hypothetical protein